MFLKSGMHCGLKLFTSLILLFTISALHVPLALLSGAAISFLMFMLAPSKLIIKLRALRLPCAVLLLMLPFLIFSPGTEIVFKAGPLKASDTGFALFFELAVKSLSMFMILTFLIDSTESRRLTSAIQRIGVPEKLIMLIQYTYKYIAIYLEDLQNLKAAARLRGYSVQKFFAHGITSAHLLFSLIIRSYEQSERVNSAMCLRGFTGIFPKAAPEKVLVSDILYSALIISPSILLIILEITC